MTDQELRDLVASLVEAQKETDRQLRELGKQVSGLGSVVGSPDEPDDDERTSKKLRKTLREEQEETARQIRELGKQIGGLGNTFGYFTEGLALPSVERLLFDRFGAEDFSVRRKKHLGTDTIEIDALGIVNGERREAYIVEVKSELRPEDLEQLKSTLRRFRDFFSDYATYKLFGVFAVANAGENEVHRAWREGFFVIAFDDSIMQFHEPNDFVPKVF
jgi:DNA-binding transcriptional MerR regulator